MSNYTIFGIIILILLIWLAFELWRAPIAEETEEEGFKIIKPGKKLSDLFKKRK